ncbi:hypothetical protein [uncultured Cobetia sp.]|uniref:hypothetical protein n=1 Tax=uncultured Cobetia sp. TaxID=410706 RepID=UPI0030ED7FD8
MIEPATQEVRVRADGDVTADLLAQFIQRDLRALAQRQHLLAILIEQRAGLGGNQAIGLTMQQWLAELVFEMTDPAAERGLGDTEMLGSCAQIAVAHDGIEGTEALKFVKYWRHDLVAPAAVVCR